jgi:biopolymer transport protein ExbB
MSAFLQFLTEEWYFAFSMLSLSCVALMLVFWRYLLNRDARTPLSAFLPAFQETLERDGIDGALRLCRPRKDFIPGRLYVAGLEAAPEGLSAMRRAMADAIALEILPELNFLLAPILAIAKIATMVGLLGTVISMINTFTAITEADTTEGVPMQAGAIGLALFATALGLITAIPLVFSHVLFKAWVARFEVQLKSAAQKLLVLVDAVHHAVAVADKPAPTIATELVPPPVRIIGKESKGADDAADAQEGVPGNAGEVLAERSRVHREPRESGGGGSPAVPASMPSCPETSCASGKLQTRSSPLSSAVANAGLDRSARSAATT